MVAMGAGKKGQGSGHGDRQGGVRVVATVAVRVVAMEVAKERSGWWPKRGVRMVAGCGQEGSGWWLWRAQGGG